MFMLMSDVRAGKRGEKKKKNSAFDHDKIKLDIIVGMIINSVEIRLRFDLFSMRET